MEQYILPVAFFLGLGAVIGILLTIAAKVFYVKTDETVRKITEALPGANCGGCGYSGCAGYAEAVAAGKAQPDLCNPGGPAAAEKIGAILGIEVQGREAQVAFIRCNGNCDATDDKFTYIGTKSCSAVERFYNGKGVCRTRCHGMGDCAAVCDNNCISVQNGIARVDPMNCIGCGKCVKACPNELIVLIRASQRTMVQCYSADSGKDTRKICKNGCIACGMCVKKCPEQAVVINNNHAEINTVLCTGCGICASVCPVKCITEFNCNVKS